jgi:hypothetical protein
MFFNHRPKQPKKATPLGTILRDRDASIALHDFLLGQFDETRKTEIRVGPEKFAVKIIDLNPAPPFPK